MCVHTSVLRTPYGHAFWGLNLSAVWASALSASRFFEGLTDTACQRIHACLFLFFVQSGSHTSPMHTVLPRVYCTSTVRSMYVLYTVWMPTARQTTEYAANNRVQEAGGEGGEGSVTCHLSTRPAALSPSDERRAGAGKQKRNC